MQDLECTIRLYYTVGYYYLNKEIIGFFDTIYFDPAWKSYFLPVTKYMYLPVYSCNVNTSYAIHVKYKDKVYLFG